MTEAPLAAVVHHLRQLGAAAVDTSVSDGQLLQCFTAGREELAFAALLERHGRLVWSVCRNVLRHDQDAEDAFQATFLILARKAGSIRKHESIASWLHGVAYRVALRARIRAAAQRARELLVQRDAVPEPSTEASLRELQAILDEEVNRLPDHLRAPFVLCCLQGQSRSEAARALGWKEGTVAGRLGLAREKLRVRLSRRGLALSASLTSLAVTQGGASAAVPSALGRATMSAVMGRVAGPAATTLAEGVLQALFAARVKMLAGVLLLLAVCATGAGLVVRKATTLPTTQPDSLPASAADAQPPVRRDLAGDPLPPGAVARLGTTRLRHQGIVQAVAVTPPGWRGKPLLASAGTDGVIRLWDPDSGKLRYTLPSHSSVRCLAFAPDGKTLAVGGKGALLLWDMTRLGRPDLKPMRAAGHAGAALTVVFARDGKTLYSGGEDDSLITWDVATGKELRRVRTGATWIRSIDLAPDGRTLALAQLSGPAPMRERVRLRDAKTGKELRPVGREMDTIYQVVFSPDGRSLAVASNGGLCLLAVAGRQTALAGQLLAAETTDHERFHSAQGREWGRPLSYCAAFTPDGKTVIAGSAGRLRRWEVATGKELLPYEGEQTYFYSLAFTPDGKTLACASAPAVGVWDVRTGKERRCAPGHVGEVSSLHFTPDSKHLFTGGLGALVRRWELDTGREIGQLRGKIENNGNAVVPPDGKRLVVQGDNQVVHLLDTATGNELYRFEAHQPPVGSNATTAMAFAFTPDSQTLASAALGLVDRTIRLWDVATGKEKQRLAGSASGPAALAFTSDGKVLASAFWDGTVSVWDVASGSATHCLRLSGWAPPRLAFAPGTRLLAVGHGTKVTLIDAAAGRTVRSWTGPQGEATGLSFSRDGYMLAVAGSQDRRVFVYETASGKVRLTISSHGGPVKAVSFAPNGRWLATGGEDTTALIWDVEALALSNREAVAWLSSRPVEELGMLLNAPDAADAYRFMLVMELRSRAAVTVLEKQLLVEAAHGVSTDTMRLYQWRALEVLERINSPLGWRLIRRIAQGPAESVLVQAARAAWKRLRERGPRYKA